MRVTKLKPLYVLAWRPVVKDREELAEACERSPVVQAYADVLSQDVDAHAGNIAFAWDEWQKLEKKYQAIEVYGYAPIPTLVGVWNDQNLLIEAVPWNAPPGGQRSPDGRPAFSMNKTNQPEGYLYFSRWFEDLLKHALQTEQSVVDRKERDD